MKDTIAFGLVSAFIGACFGIDETGQFILFAFGVTWGRMMMRIDDGPVLPPADRPGEAQ